MTFTTSNMDNATIAYTELAARTQFIMGRVAFLKDVAETLMDEGKPASDAKINVWLNNAYIPLIVRCIKSDDEAVRDDALWTVANLLGADTIAVREETKNALSADLLQIALDCVFLDSTETVESAAFLLSNYARFNDISFADAKSIIIVTCAKGILTTGKAATDLLWAANYMADKFPAAIPLSLVVNTLGDIHFNKDKARLLRRLLGIASEQDGLMHEGLLNPVISVLERLLGSSQSSGVRAELFWILSNVLTEPGAPEMFFRHKKLLSYTITASSYGSNAGLQATYALANFVTNVKDTMIQAVLACGAGSICADVADDEEGYTYDIYDTFDQLSSSENATLNTIGTEVMEILKHYMSLYGEDVDTEVDTEVDTDEEDDSIIEDITPTPTVPLARTEENIAPATNNTEWHIRVPCAYELLYGSDRPSCESSVVRHLVGLVEQAMSDPDMEGDGWVKIPLDTIISVSDLITLKHMGYVFDGEWLGVNPAIYSGY